MRAQTGDEIVVESQVVGRPPRRGRIQEVLGEADTQHFRVLWEDGHESAYFPGADGHVVRPTGAVPLQADAPRETSADKPSLDDQPSLPHQPSVPAQPSLADVAVVADRIDGHTPLRGAAAALARSPVGAVLVQELGSPPALVSQQDLLAALAAGADPDVVWVADIAASTTSWAARDERLSRVAERMRDAQAQHVLVRDRNGLVGIACLADVLAGILDARFHDGLVGT